ncbi:hypothetical protein BDZ91DRAFT_745357, partial [Kalaharituber pfeilii]
MPAPGLCLVWKQRKRRLSLPFFPFISSWVTNLFSSYIFFITYFYGEGKKTPFFL